MKLRKLFRLGVMLCLVSAYLLPLASAASPTVAAPLAAPIPVTFSIDTGLERASISPYIYGTNQDLTGTERWTSRRLGGNRLTGYNWENNASNAGSDWQQSSDDFLCGSVGVPTGACTTAGSVVTTFHDKSLQMGAYSLVTLQMAGYVAKDKNGTVAVGETAPSARWDPVVNVKGSAFAYPPSLTDSAVYMNEEVGYLVSHYGNASTANGVKAYDLDNEPALWPSTHPRIHPNATGAAELVNKSIALSKAVKNVDAGAAIFGPVAYGFMEFYSLQDAADWASVKGSSAWYIDYYLAQMKQASDADGRRLLDALDVHWYPEAQGCGVRIVFNGVGSTCVQQARVQAPRTLWDSTYLESSWIASSFPTFLPLLPRLQQSINTYYPGTKLAITEYSYGGDNDISGGIAHADALGIFGKLGVYLATFWQTESPSTYITAATKLYRNYDGANSTYGDTKVKANTTDIANSSVYASVMASSNNTLHLIVLNKSFTDPLSATFNLTSNANYTSGQVWSFNATSPNIVQGTPLSGITGNSFSLSVPALTAMHIVLQAGTGPTNTPGPTATSTKTFTPAPPTWTPTNTPLPSNTPTPCVNCALKVQYKNGENPALPSDNQVKPHIQILNNGGSSVALNTLKARYWFTRDTAQPQTFYCDFAVVGCGTITQAMVQMGTPVTGADFYLEVGFSSGTLNAGASTGEIQNRFNKNDWSNYNENDDWSFGANVTYADAPHVTLYQSGSLVWGTEPGGGGPTNTPVATNTPTNTPVATNTPTNTPVATNTPTNTPVATNTPTNTPVVTPTPTNTTCVCPTNTPTNTPVPTNTPTNTPVPTNTPTNTPIGPTPTPGGNLCATPTVITGGGSYSVPLAGVCFKYVNATFVRGGMWSVMNGSDSTVSNVVKWYGGRNETVTACLNDSQTLNGNGAQLNNFTVAKDANNAMFVTITTNKVNTVSMSIQNWQNGTGCSVAPTPQP
jgi:hypothetical protein